MALIFLWDGLIFISCEHSLARWLPVIQDTRLGHSFIKKQSDNRVRIGGGWLCLMTLHHQEEYHQALYRWLFGSWFPNVSRIDRCSALAMATSGISFRVYCSDLWMACHSCLIYRISFLWVLADVIRRSCDFLIGDFLNLIILPANVSHIQGWSIDWFFHISLSLSACVLLDVMCVWGALNQELLINCFCYVESLEDESSI